MKTFFKASIVLSSLLVMACQDIENKSVENQKQVNKEIEKPASQPSLTIHVYNMGGCPASDVSQLVDRLKDVYPKTEYSGELALVDSAYIRNDPKGKNRYWWSKLCANIQKTTDTRTGVSVVIINAEVCNWLEGGKSHANLGISGLGNHITFVSYERLKQNNLNTVDNMLKIVIHELGHSVASLVRDRKDLRRHCPDAYCLMRDAKNRFPYRNIKSFCPSCDKAMKSNGFKTENLKL